VADNAASETAPTKPPEGPVDMKQFKDDPLIQKALEVFKGQIVDVRT
jgi:inhibitor of KinA sporulation pathway (predicted exonuclease)